MPPRSRPPRSRPPRALELLLELEGRLEELLDEDLDRLLVLEGLISSAAAAVGAAGPAAVMT